MNEVTTLDSRTETTAREAPAYVGSESGHAAWGQPPISHYHFTMVGGTLRGQLISGTYCSFSEDRLPTVIDSQLAAEFAAWERVSDEALVAFEESLG